MTVFTYSKWLKIGITFFLILLIGVFTVLIFMPFFDSETSINSAYIIAPISISFIFLCLLGIRDLFVSNVIITKTYITAKNVIFDRKLRLEEIKGYKKVKNYILVYPKSKLKKKLKISNYISDNGEIEYWLQNNFIDLNLLEEEKEIKEFYKNSEYGISFREKNEMLKKAHLASKWIKILSISLTLLCLLFGKYFSNQYFVFILLFIPLIIIFIVFYFKGIIKYNEKEEDENTIYPTVLWGFLLPIFGLFLYVMFYINILKYDAVWSPLIYATLFIFFLCIYGSKEYKVQNSKAIGTILSLFVFSAMYCYCFIIIYNVFFDDTNTKLYIATIKDKRISKGKTTNYYFLLNNKELSENDKEFSVSKVIFNEKNKGDLVNVFVNQGRLNIPYYLIE